MGFHPFKYSACLSPVLEVAEERNDSGSSYKKLLQQQQRVEKKAAMLGLGLVDLTEVTRVENEMKRLKKDKAQGLREIEKLGTKLAGAEKKVKDLNRQINRLKRENDKMGTDRDSLRTNIERLSRQEHVPESQDDTTFVESTIGSSKQMKIKQIFDDLKKVPSSLALYKDSFNAISGEHPITSIQSVLEDPKREPYLSQVNLLSCLVHELEDTLTELRQEEAKGMNVLELQ
ncbi:hypothetical protein CJU90_0160 [Yarrowia sp. C11]|nr:hypothetical protein CKK34_1571 [Yarrowia sp. E02]KAG5372518.1 hypothetical protein CJU90_0160 [Yarrowia sp. C11]